MVSPALEGLLPDDSSEETVTVSRKKLEALLKELRDLAQQVELLRQAQLSGASRLPPPPAWVRANVPRDSSPKKRGAKEGHEAHHRPPPSRIDETEEVELPCCPKCGEDLGDPFEVDERTVESIVPGHVRVTTYRIGRYRCRHCKKVRRARLPPEVAPPRSPFSWSTHFLVGYWSMKGLTNSLIREFLATDYGLKVSQGVVDNMLHRAAELFAPAYVVIRLALKEGRQVNVDWTGWRVDGINHHFWDFVSPTREVGRNVVYEAGTKPQRRRALERGVHRGNNPLPYPSSTPSGVDRCPHMLGTKRNAMNQSHALRTNAATGGNTP